MRTVSAERTPMRCRASTRPEPSPSSARRATTLGAAPVGEGICVYMESDKPYRGRLQFDVPRHRLTMGFQQDWPRMNAVPEWFVVEPDEVPPRRKSERGRVEPDEEVPPRRKSGQGRLEPDEAPRPKSDQGLVEPEVDEETSTAKVDMRRPRCPACKLELPERKQGEEALQDAWVEALSAWPRILLP